MARRQRLAKKIAMARIRRATMRMNTQAKKMRKARREKKVYCGRGGHWLRSKNSTEAERKLGGLRLRMDCGGGMKKGYRYSDERKMAMRSDREARAAARG